ncbi:uncharacterized protein LOC131166435 isoform X3 [Malania oleifera]|uniref:uncharacterized protein LOC131166435 isoform X3 n=1 Tax=Malania oleifera TaxID=397392 RepID=UPI0025AD9D39|nr:uncharacterized protein LOC131166435 isoform X3 [Malania oleifera]
MDGPLFWIFHKKSLHLVVESMKSDLMFPITSKQNSMISQLPALEMGSDEAAGHKDGETILLQNCSFSAEDTESFEKMGFSSSTCSTHLETIFSPIVEFNDVHWKQDNTGSKKDTAVRQMTIHYNDGDNESSNLSGYQSVLAPCIFDMSVTGSPITAIAQCDEIVKANFSADFEYADAEPSMMIDMAERCMMLPSLEETVETVNTHYSGSCGEFLMNSDDSWFYLLSHQSKPCDQELDVNASAIDSDEVDCFDPQLFIRNFPDLSEGPNWLPALSPRETKKKQITLVLDLDETLVHSSLEPCEDADFTFPVLFDMKEHTVYVRQRPFLRTFLEKVAEMFEIIVFTASQSIYAEQLLDVLDPDKIFFSRRAYRESCIFSDGGYTKDLTVLGVDLAKVAIIDNSPQVFRLQVDNGIPIKSWFDDPSDRALISLLPFLETLVDADDVRPIIAKRFNVKE